MYRSFHRPNSVLQTCNAVISKLCLLPLLLHIMLHKWEFQLPKMINWLILTPLYSHHYLFPRLHLPASLVYTRRSLSGLGLARCSSVDDGCARSPGEAGQLFLARVARTSPSPDEPVGCLHINPSSPGQNSSNWLTAEWETCRELRPQHPHMLRASSAP